MSVLKTLNGIAKASLKTYGGLAVASWQTWNGLAISSGATYEYLDAKNDGTDLTTYSFAAVNFGTATADRLIVVNTGIGAAFDRTISSATIGGVAATLVSNNSGRVHIISAVVPTGTSGTVSITFSGAAVRCGINAHAIKGYMSSTATGTGNDGPASAASKTATVTVNAGGVGIAGSWIQAVTTVSSWTGCTIQNQQQMEALNSMSAAAVTTASLLTNNAFTCTWNTTNNMQVAAAAWA